MTATPKLILTRILFSSIGTSRDITAARRDSAVRRAPFRSVPGSRTANSSPPSRAARSVAQAHVDRLRDPFDHPSPAWCPSESLMP
jgi:hypothetical protein